MHGVGTKVFHIIEQDWIIVKRIDSIIIVNFRFTHLKLPCFKEVKGGGAWDIDKNWFLNFLGRRNLNSLYQTYVTVVVTYRVRVAIMLQQLPRPRPGGLLGPETKKLFSVSGATSEDGEGSRHGRNYSGWL